MSARWEAAQRAAADPAASVFVTANAGSGKTKVLVDRIARLLLEGSRPSSFLCVTYTKAAAAEMQRRLFERLGEWCVTDDEKLTKELAALEGPDAPAPTREQLAKARALFARALETPGGLKIQTIHAFCERLLARFPLEAGVPPGFDIADEPRAAALLARARAACILNADDKLAAAFSRFAEKLHGEALEGFLNRLALRRADFRSFAEKHKDEVFAEAELKNRHGARQSSEAFAAEFVGRVNWTRLRDAIGVLRASGPSDAKVAERIAEALALQDASWPARAVTEAVLSIALKEDGEAYKRLITKTLAKQQPWLEMLLDALAEQCIAARTALNAIDRAEDTAAALALALKLDGAYDAAKTRAGVLDFDDLIAHAQALLSRAEAAPWVLYKLDGGLDHILIDEGQDTSPSQWDLIAPLMDEFFAGGGARDVTRTVFAVGDPKQSIYAFQGADPDRFLREDQHLDKRARRAKRKFTAPVLETSFRSSPEILSVVDAVFADKDLAPGAPEKFNEVRHIAARAAQPGLVELWPITPRPQAGQSKPWDAPLDIETEQTPQAVLARAIAKRARKWIEDGEGVWDKSGKALRAIEPGDILALVRTRGGLFRELIKAFKREQFPVAGADRMILRDELAVEDCLALIRVALDPADDLALACVLKGPWCDLDDDNADLFPLAYGRGKYETLHARLMANAEEKYAHARTFVNELTQRGGVDPFSFLSWALETPHGGGPAGWTRVFARLGAETRDPLEELLQRAVKGSAASAPSLQRFLHDIEVDAGQVKRELEAAGGAVRVMTVHGAKGLEAPIVILPDCTGPVSDRPEDGLMFEAGEPFVSFRTKEDDAAVSTARAAYASRMLGEHWRLLYVALTRARDRLIVCGAQYGSARSGVAQNAWRTAVEDALSDLGAQSCETPFGEGLRLGAPLKLEGRAAPRTAAALPEMPNWLRTQAPGVTQRAAATPSRMKLIDPTLLSPRGDGSKRFRRGRLIHGLLERLPDVSAARRAEAAQIWLTRQGVKQKEAEALTREALSVLEDSRFAGAFTSASRAEAPIVGEAAGRPVRGVVDRLAVDETTVTVLDYKTDRPAPPDPESAPDSYVLQMALYREVLRKIFPQKAVRCALLWTEKPLLTPLSDAQLDDAFARFARS
ncbi:MAG: double-strand break repair helicase AddA [Hyphomonadaceae bacterium]|nr:double-strand break repair helicase AddA [Hyphomonadaceae bacterium]